MLTLLLALVACGEEESSYSPYVTIETPADGDSFPDDIPVLLVGTALDGDSDEDALVANFALDGEAVCADVAVESDGHVECETLIPEDEHVLTLVVVDPDGNEGSAEEITVVGVHDYPPTVIIDSPADGEVLYGESGILLSGSASDDLDEPEDLVSWWESDQDGLLGAVAALEEDGTTSTTITLNEGDHVLTLFAEDTAGGQGTASVSVTVGAPNTEPVCEITSPEDGDSSAPGVTVNFLATVSDGGQDLETLEVLWESSLDGVLGTDGPTADGDVAVSSDSLEFGVHVITLTIVDNADLSCTDSLTLVIGNEPALTVLTPIEGETLHDVDGVDFEAIATDEDGENTELTVVWTSSIDGEFASEVPATDGSVSFTAEDLTPGAQTITVLASDSDGLTDSAVISFEINVGPDRPSVQITPDPVYTGNTLVAVMVTESKDPEGAEISYAWEWFVDGGSTVMSTSDTVTSDLTTKDETWEVVLTPNDGLTAGDPGSASITIMNTPPTLGEVFLLPDPGYLGVTLECEANGPADEDGDPVTVSVQWIVNGSDIAVTGTTLTGDYHTQGDVVQCEVTPNDGYQNGSPVSSNEVAIANRVPEITGVSVTPGTATAEDTLGCSYSGYSDADGDPDNSTFSWTIAGTEVGTTEELSGVFAKGDEVVCTVTPNDGIDDGSSLSDSVTIRNMAPSIGGAEITPDPAYTGDTLVCTSVDFEDGDGDADVSNVNWIVNGHSAGTGDTLAGGFHGGDLVECECTASDGEEIGNTLLASLNISNTAPEVLSVSLSPVSPTTDEELNVSATTDDLDGDSVSLEYSWSVDGIDQGVYESSLNGSYYFAKGQEVSVTVTPFDGTDIGSTMTSSAVTVVNTAPGQPTVVIDPDQPYSGVDDLLCVVDLEADDVDEDPLSYTMTWLVDGLDYSDATTTTWTGDTVPSSDTLGGERWECSALPDDGEAEGTAGTMEVLVNDCFSVDFDGSSSYGTVGDSTDLQLAAGNFTLEAWFRLDSLGTDDTHLISKRDASTSWAGWVLGVTGSSSIHGSGKVFFARSEFEEMVGSSTLSTGSWTHVAFVHDPTASEVRIYVDGLEENSGHLASPNTATSDMVLGRDSASSGHYMEGQFSEIRLSEGPQYSGDFSPAEELEATPQTFLLFSFGEGSGSVLEDISGNGNDASLTNTSWVYSCNFK